MASPAVPLDTSSGSLFHKTLLSQIMEAPPAVRPSVRTILEAAYPHLDFSSTVDDADVDDAPAHELRFEFKVLLFAALLVPALDFLSARPVEGTMILAVIASIVLLEAESGIVKKKPPLVRTAAPFPSAPSSATGNPVDQFTARSWAIFFLADLGCVWPFLIGVMLEPDHWLEIVAWFAYFAAAPVTAGHFSPTLLVASAFGVAFGFPHYVARTAAVKFLYGMAGLIRALRICELVRDVDGFRSKPAVYRFAFVSTTYHDLRQVRTAASSSSGSNGNNNNNNDDDDDDDNDKNKSGDQSWEAPRLAGESSGSAGSTGCSGSVFAWLTKLAGVGAGLAASVGMLVALRRVGAPKAEALATSFLPASFPWPAALPVPAVPTTPLGLAVAFGRLVCGTSMFYFMVNFVDQLWRFHLLLLGLEATRGMDHPLSSKTLAEFWSKRWNKSIQKILRDAFYLPLAGRGLAQAGVFATFVGSAILHVYPFLLEGDRVPAVNAACMAAFFVVQFPLVAAEKALGLRGSWWFVLAFTATLPLFMYPTLALFDEISTLA